jgi:hypothetical protein
MSKILTQEEISALLEITEDTDTSKAYVGIDIGADGGMAILNEDIDDSVIYSLTSFKDGGLKKYIQIITEYMKRFDLIICIEQVHSMPNQGVKSVFSFGQRLGEVEGMLQTLGLEYNFVSPRSWINFTKSGGKKTTKRDIYEYVHSMYPDADLLGPKGGIRTGITDALGIAHFYKKLKETDGN